MIHVTSKRFPLKGPSLSAKGSMQRQLLRIQHLSTLHGFTVCKAGSQFGSQNASSVQKRRQTTDRNAESARKKFTGGFPEEPMFSSRIEECIPLAVKRHRERPYANPWQPINARSPKNKIVTLPNGERKIYKQGKLLPLYRDWEREFGKPSGDSRSYYRKKMGPMLMPYRENPRLETVKSLIVVEGITDWKNVTIAVFVCDGAAILSHVYQKYVKKSIRSYDGDLILLFDPDTAGRRMRTSVNSLMTPCKHAFIPEYEAVVGMGTPWESIGIEHASVDSIRNALKTTRTFNREAERTIAFDDLYEIGLVQTPAERTEGVRLRRRFTCGFLGIGFCDGKQLLKQLNGYGFTMEEVRSAACKAEILLEEWKKQPWRLQKDGTSRPPPSKDTFTISNNFLSAF